MNQQLKVEFGDFQTPIGLASEVCAVLVRRGLRPRSVLEPSCGQGAFLRACIQQFPDATQYLGIELNSRYVTEARTTLRSMESKGVVHVRCGDFFETDWNDVVSDLPDPILIIGNPPWVTSSALGALASDNLPSKRNVDGLRGIDALTGKSNFDISEWMLRCNAQSLSGRTGVLAVLCKTTVARKILTYCWNNELSVRSAEIRRIDAKSHFGASVDACLLIIEFGSGKATRECAEFDTLASRDPTRITGIRKGSLVANVRDFDRWLHLDVNGLPSNGWRSGVKHDCSKVFELRRRSVIYENGFGETVDLESSCVYPLLKGSDLASNRQSQRWILIPQRRLGESPERLESDAPKAWRYLMSHADHLNGRKSSIYQKRPRFSVFGIGDYSFSPWKVAISGMYKKLAFIPVSPIEERPVFLDDTSYLFACGSQEDRDLLIELVNSDIASEFWHARVFWDSKRPITASILNSLDLGMLANDLGLDGPSAQRLSRTQRCGFKPLETSQMLLFSAK